jgi:hypothetical protein
VRIETSDTELLEAVHEVLRYQITEYHTDDPLDVNRSRCTTRYASMRMHINRLLFRVKTVSHAP